jgi:hypothetical protein
LPNDLRPAFMYASAALIASTSDKMISLTCGRTVPASVLAQPHLGSLGHPRQRPAQYAAWYSFREKI